MLKFYSKHQKLILNLCLYFNFFIKEIKIINNELSFILNDPNKLKIILLFLKNHYKFQFKELIDICTVDYCYKNIDYRFQLNYFLLSLKYKIRLKIKIYLNLPTIINSSITLYSSSNWLERENWDLFGIFFVNHTDLRRILTDYGFDGFPFRKDFPLSGYIELRFDDEKKIVVYEKLELMQEFRFFDFVTPWDWNYNLILKN